MDPITNPYVPNAGAPPPALVGRGALLDAAKIALARTKAGRAAKSLMPTGLRGVGKTVLLNRFVAEAEKLGYRSAYLEASERGNFVGLLAAELRKLLLELDRGARVKQVAKRAIAVLKSFTLTAKLGDLAVTLGVDPLVGAADSGDLSLDLTDLFVAIGQAARAEESAVLIAIDEVQYLSERELEALIMAVHRVTQLTLPLTVIGTGLPQLPALAGNAKSYAERLFEYPIVGALNAQDAARAIVEPAATAHVVFTTGALRSLFQITKGYPFFIQEWAYHVWNRAAASPITEADVKGVEAEVLRRLDEGFFRVRFGRLTPTEKNYLRAMAELGAGPHGSGAIAERLGVKSSAVGPVRDSLAKKGMIYSPRHGQTAFTVPLFDAFMRREMPGFRAHGAGRRSVRASRVSGSASSAPGKPRRRR